MPEPVFRRADRFSHFGVYAEVDSRTQYYVVEPVLAKDAQALAAGGPGPWFDEERPALHRHVGVPVARTGSPAARGCRPPFREVAVGRTAPGQESGRD